MIDIKTWWWIKQILHKQHEVHFDLEQISFISKVILVLNIIIFHINGLTDYGLVMQLCLLMAWHCILIHISHVLFPIIKHETCKLIVMNTTGASNGHVTWVAITGSIIWVPYLKVLQLIWRSGTCRFHLQLPAPQINCRDLTTWQGANIMPWAMAVGQWICSILH